MLRLGVREYIYGLLIDSDHVLELVDLLFEPGVLLSEELECF